LKPEEQFTTPSGSSDHGPCDKCGGTGSVQYQCRSCLADGASQVCPACRGRVRFEDVCPACEGSGEITRTRRRGIAAFPTLGGLSLYLREKRVDLTDRVIVELEGTLSSDRELDADCGAVLIYPTGVVSVLPARDSVGSS
jgi:hypothetical protein